jgi:L-ascorbate metabolism protein UlaG (beta-lactamase superfamily)
MNSSLLVRGLALGALGFAILAPAQDMRFTDIHRLTNGQIVLKFVAPTGVNYRVDATTNFHTTNTLPWTPLVNTQSVGFNQFTDTAAAPHSARFYRASSNILTGDALFTTNGEVVIHPLYHASLVMSWNGRIIYSDPDDDANYESRYTGLPQGDLILITHEHGDHYVPAKLTALRKAGGVVIVPQKVYNRPDFAGYRPNAIPLQYGQTTTVQGITVLAVPGYDNSNHAYTNNNCYVLTIGGKRIFISGDTADVSDIRTLTGIDVAFLCMNRQFTMNWLSATNVIRSMRPKVVYPYHYREGNGAQTNAALFNAAMSNVLDIEVRLRNWY